MQGRRHKRIRSRLDASIFREIRQIKLLYHGDTPQSQLVATLVSVVGMVAVALSCVGIVGLVTFVVTRRQGDRNPYGARLATRAAVLTAVPRRLRRPVAVGLAAGAMFAAAGSRGLRVVLYGVNNLAVESCIAGGALLAAVVSLSMLIPPCRALRLNLATIFALPFSRVAHIGRVTRLVQCD